jgi:hypothetical protein
VQRLQRVGSRLGDDRGSVLGQLPGSNVGPLALFSKQWGVMLQWLGVQQARTVRSPSGSASPISAISGAARANIGLRWLIIPAARITLTLTLTVTVSGTQIFAVFCAMSCCDTSPLLPNSMASIHSLLLERDYWPKGQAGMAREQHLSNHNHKHSQLLLPNILARCRGWQD